MLITLLTALSNVAVAAAQTPPGKEAPGREMVPIAGIAMRIVGREFGGIDCQTDQPIGFGMAAIWYPYVARIPDEQLFQPGATVQNETTAILTTVFPKVTSSLTTNDKIIDVYLQPHQVFSYYHPNSSPEDWTDFDGFQAGDLIGVLTLGYFVPTSDGKNSHCGELDKLSGASEARHVRGHDAFLRRRHPLRLQGNINRAPSSRTPRRAPSYMDQVQLFLGAAYEV
jgi:hypothetical protein